VLLYGNTTGLRADMIFLYGAGGVPKPCGDMWSGGRSLVKLNLVPITIEEHRFLRSSRLFPKLEKTCDNYTRRSLESHG
jgi:hypothetical protein